MRLSKNKLIWLAKFFFSTILLTLLIYKVDLVGFFSALKKVNIFYLSIALITQFLNIFIRSLKWQILLKVHNIHFPLLTIQNFNYMSIFFNNFFLGTLGGDIFRVYIISQNSLDIRNATSSIFIERLTGFISAVFLVVLFGLFLFMNQNYFFKIRHVKLLIIIFCFLLFFIIIMLYLYFRYFQFKLKNKFDKIQSAVDLLVKSLMSYRRHNNILLLSLCYSMLFHILNGFSLFFLVKSTHTITSISAMLFVSPLVSLIVMIPVSISGIGIQEGSYFYYFQQFGIESGNALAIAFLARSTLLIWGLVGGFIFFTKRNINSKSQ
ncbi:MAG: flippase-like domain-containing protein [Candidatus Marinimicrobia bacterium]|nr:flippase-like domain-containing protein [Candidatus Neomarinimicrobiota bacterium]